jgi:hypothetical protein
MPTNLPLLESALRPAERGGTLIQRLLAFARKQRLDPRSIDLNHLVVGMEDLLRHTLGDRIRVASRAASGPAPSSLARMP